MREVGGVFSQFMNERRRRVYPRIFVVLCVFWGVVGFAYLWANAARNDERYGGDFVVYWSAARLAEQGRPEDVYDVRELWAEEKLLVPNSEAFPWHYPPQFLLLLRPFAWLPYWAALATWTVLGLGALGVAVYATGARGWATPAVSLLAVGVNVAFGQNGMFTGAILGGGLALLDSRPGFAGAILGLLTYKPHFAPLIFILLLATRRWTALSGAVLSTACLAGLSLGVFGLDTWHAYINDLRVAADVLYEPGAWEKMPSLTATLMLLNVPRPATQIAQALWSLVVVAVVVQVWRSGTTAPVRNAAALAGTFAASPYVFVYDLVALAPAYGWLVLVSSRGKLGTAGIALLAGCAVLPIAGWALAALTSIQLGPLLLALLMARIVAARRAVDTDDGTSLPTEHPLAPDV
ncbi:MAG: DUF2029 domain-containing protein [Dehalococcoidia bacterium]|nr:DUF2029 domain-containing protein [Dehalococcoidia bacterium]